MSNFYWFDEEVALRDAVKGIDASSIQLGMANPFPSVLQHWRVLSFSVKCASDDARASTHVDPDGISFSTDLPGPCRLLIRNSIPRITLSAALLHRHAWESRQGKSCYLVARCSCPAFPTKLYVRSKKIFLRLAFPFLECINGRLPV